MTSWKSALSGAVVLLGWFSFGPSLLGHGGGRAECSYGGSAPPVEVPPVPESPPSSPAGPTAQPPITGVPTPKPGSTKPGGTATPPAAPAKAATGGPAAATRRGGATESLDRWEFWWEANESRWLVAPSTRSAPNTTAIGTDPGTANPPAAFGPSAAVLRTRALPQLLTLLATKENVIADASALALGHLVQANEANLALVPLTRALDHAEATVRESAALALGMVGSTAALPTLRELLLDTPKGRQLTSHPAGVEERVRSVAAVAIGLIGERASFVDLRRILEEPQLAGHVELQQLTLCSLGLLRGAHDQVVPYVLELLGRRDLHRIVRAEVPTVLSQIAADPAGAFAAKAALARLVALVQEKPTETDLRRSAVIALGRIARPEDQEALDALAECIERCGDSPARHFALIALAEIGGDDADPAAHAAEQERIESLLTRELESPRRSEHRPFAALALGIWSRNPALAADRRERVGGCLLGQLATGNHPSHRGALALGLGLSNAPVAAAPIAGYFAETKDPVQKGYLALALGLLRSREHAPLLLRELDLPRLEPSLEIRLARSLALIGSDELTAKLIERLRGADTAAEVGPTVLALARTGDGRALEPLLAVAVDATLAAGRRGVAAESLGVLATASELPWNAVFELDTNYLARSPALAQLVTLF